MDGIDAGPGGLRHRRRNLPLVISLGCILLIAGAAVAAPLLTPFGPTEQRLEERFLPPLSAGHLLGTDDIGRDILTRIVYGSRAALLVGLASVSVALAAGLAAGLSAGFIGGVLDAGLMLVSDAVLSFPTVLLAIAVVSVMGYGLPQVTLALGVIFSPVITRLVRAETLALRTEGFVESARALGTPWYRILTRHIVPNLIGRLVVQGTIIFALAIVIEASLSYLGLGSQPPEPSWGLMLKDARNYLSPAPWMAIAPGVALALTVFSFNLLGDAVSDLFDPRGRR